MISIGNSKAISLPAVLSAGLLFATGFAPFSFSSAALVAIVILIHFLGKTKTPREAALHAFLFGLGWFSLGLSWTMNSVAVHGHLPWAVAGIALVLLSCVLSLFTGGAAFAAKLSAGESPGFPFAFASFLLLSEWLRGGIVAHFGWLAPGYAWMNTPLLGWAPLGGIHAASFAGILLAACLAMLLKKEGGRTKYVMGVLIPLFILAIGHYSLSKEWSRPDKGIELGILQPDLPVVDAWTKIHPAERIESLIPLLSNIVWKTDAPRLLMTPEGVLNLPIEYVDGKTADALLSLQKRGAAPLLFNGFRSSGTGYRNTEFVLVEEGFLYVLDKRRLVPFGEFVPAGARWFVDLLGIPMADLEKGDDHQAMLKLGDASVAFLICYENMYGSLLRANHMSGMPDLIAVTANLGWFGRAILPQHLDMSRMRAVETARPLVYVGNTGMSAVISEKGKILGKLKDEGADSGVFFVEGASGSPTPYVKYGDAPALLLSALIALFFVFDAFKRSRRKKILYKEYN